MKSKVQWLGKVEWLGEDNAVKPEFFQHCPPGTVPVGNLCVPLQKPAAASTEDVPKASAEVPAGPVIDCAVLCKGKTGTAYLACITTCQQISLMKSNLPILEEASPLTEKELTPEQKAALDTTPAAKKPPAEEKTPWGLIIGGVALVGAAAWALGAFGGGLVAENPNEHRAHPTKYKVSVRQHGASTPSRTWGPFDTKEGALSFIAQKKEEARRMGWNVVFSLREPTENWGSSGPLRPSGWTP